MIAKTLLAGAAALALLQPGQLAAQGDVGGEAQVLSAPKIEYTRWVLDNGLQVIAIPDNTTANVTTSLWYEVGSKHDPQARSGFAHLFEHILSRQTLNMPYNLINKLTEDVGGIRNASTGVDRTNYYETVPGQYLETMLWTHRERMAYPVIDSLVFETERSVVKEELRQRVLAPPYGRLERFVTSENAFDVLPMRRPGIGSIEDLDATTLDDARGFHQAFYGPDTATLIVAGNFDLERLHSLVDKYFADIPRRAHPVSLRIDDQEPVRTQPRTVNATAPNVPLPVVGGLWKAPPATDPDAAAIEVLSAVLSRGDNSRLHHALVRSGKAVQALYFDEMSEDGGFIASYIVLNPDGDIDGARAILDAEVERVRCEPVSEAELREAQNELFASALAERQTARGRAFELGEALVTTGDPDAADKRLAAIAAVSAADVQRVAAQWLRPEGKVSITYTSGEDDPASYANPYPQPEYGKVPPGIGQPLAVLPEVERAAPPPPIEAPPVQSAEFVEAQLDNGIPLVTAQTSNVPIATITVVFPGGDASDPAAKAGLAGLVARVADKGTATRSATEIAAALESLGASLRFSTGADGSFASLTAPTVNLQQAGAVLADILTRASFPQEEFERERKNMLIELAATLTDPGALAEMVSTRVMYGDAPYGKVPNPGTLPAITREDLIAYREAYWHPGAARIVISGGLAADEAHALANQLFGNWTTDRPPPQPVVDPAGSAPPPRTLVIDMPDSGQAAVLASMRALSRDDPDFYKLWLANTVLGSGSNSRLFEEVRTKRALSYSAYSLLDTRTDEAMLTAQAQTKNESADEVAAVFFEQFARLGDEVIDEDALQNRRLFLAGAMARSLETSGGFNGIVASLMLRGIEPQEAFRLAERLASVSAEDVAQMAGEYLDPARASLVIVGDAQFFLDDLKALMGDIEVIRFDLLDLSSPDLRKAAAPDGGE